MNAALTIPALSDAPSWRECAHIADVADICAPSVNAVYLPRVLPAAVIDAAARQLQHGPGERRIVSAAANPSLGALLFEWLADGDVRRERLGHRADGLPDGDSGTVCGPIRRLPTGALALLKGEAWPGHEGRGCVHRSPAVDDGTPRLIFTIDALAVS